MPADHAFRTRGRRSDFVHVEIRRVGGEDGALLHDPVELAEDFFLDVHVLEHGLDDEVAVGEVFECQRARQQAHALFNVFRLEAAALGGVLVVLADHRDAAVEGFLLRLHDRDRDTNVQEVHRNATAHGAGADDANLGHGNDGRIGRNVRQLPDRAFREEHVALGGRLVARHQAHEQLALFLQAFLEVEVHGRFDALDVGFGCIIAAELLAVRLAEGCEDLRLAAGGEHLVVQVAHALQRTLLGDDLAGEGNGALAQLAFLDEFVDEAHLGALLCRDMFTGRHHLQRALGANDARQALRAAGARQETELDFRQAAFGGGNRDAIVAGERNFEAAAQRRSMDRSYDGN